MARADLMTGSLGEVVESYIAMRRGLGYRSVTAERSLREFARHLDGHQGPVPLEKTLEWATSSTSTNPRNPARRLARVRGLLRHLHALDATTVVPAPGLLGPVGHRSPPHVYSDAEIVDLLAAAGSLDPVGGLRPCCYVTLFGLLACTGMFSRGSQVRDDRWDCVAPGRGRCDGSRTCATPVVHVRCVHRTARGALIRVMSCRLAARAASSS